MNRSLADFARQFAGQPLPEVQFHVFADQIRRWQQGERVLMNDYLVLLPELKQIAPQTLQAQDRLLQEAYDTLSGDSVVTLKGPPGQMPIDVPMPPEIEIATFKGPSAASTMSVEALPDIPGFTIEKKIGMGGMGVVYKARQLLPSRTVALKVMRYGSKQDLQRFLGEAEAIAKIQHPHIVGVYQVEMLKEQPILVLEYLPGGNLREKMEGKPQAAIPAATLMRKVALAVQAAHEAGVIHRDLKPANILLDGNGEPKITDFGLAKQSESESGLTASGAIMGSPSYMAPEQAMGKIREIGTRTDVYALGAILYEMLTGRAPFLGEDPHETIMQVINQEPVSIRQLSPAVPRDLETICHKCLQKAPAARYPSAQALADDLHRFHEGNPILARRASWMERVWRWMRRHPLVCLLLLTFLGLLIAGAWIIWQYLLSQAQTNGYTGLRTLFEQALTADYRRYESQQQIYQALLQSAELLEGKGIYTPEETARQYQQLGRMASIQGESGQARKAWERALSLIAQAKVPTTALGVVKGQLLLLLGKLDSDEGQWDNSLERLNKAQSQLLALVLSLSATEAQVPVANDLRTARETYADTLHELANWHSRRRNYPEAVKGFRQAIDLRETYLKRFTQPVPDADVSHHRSVRRGIARSYGYLGDVLRNQDDLPAALASYDQSERLRQALVDEQPSDDEACFQLARSYENRCNLQARLDNTKVALDALQKAEKLLAGISQEQPGIADYQYDLSRVGSRLGVLLYDPNQPTSVGSMEARRLWERSSLLAEGLRKRDKVSLNYRGEWCFALVHRARCNEDAAEKQKQSKEAREMLSRLHVERKSPEDSYCLILCDLIEKVPEVKRSRAALLDEVQKGLAFLPQLRRDPLFQGLWPVN